MRFHVNHFSKKIWTSIFADSRSKVSIAGAHQTYGVGLQLILFIESLYHP